MSLHNVTVNNKKRNMIADIIKGISIICVVLYHFGFLKYGYLGVDCFFVVSGFYGYKSLDKKFEDNSFNYLEFIIGRLKRLMPLIIIAGIISMILGYNLMLPDDYENLSESVVASFVFLNNVLSELSIKNYWDTWNEYKPLMHTWYIGVIMQFYLIYHSVNRIRMMPYFISPLV